MKVYIYPQISSNKYIELLSDSISKNYQIAKKKKSSIGILSMLLNLNANIFVINWPENIEGKQFGIVQVFIYRLIIQLIKLRSKKIIWILHNKKSHFLHSKFSHYCVNLTAKYSDYVFTHSKDGLSFYKKKYNKNNIHYFPHPVYKELNISRNISKEYDILIWGSVDRYKQVVEFIEYASVNHVLKTKKIMVSGNCRDIEYKLQLESMIAKNTNFTFNNKFLTDSEIDELIVRSKCVLFTYRENTILSSGALVYSLSNNTKIIGPSYGSFKDLAERKLIGTYNTYSDIPELIDSFIPNKVGIEEYHKRYTWEAFADKIIELIQI